jgi:vacuolar-type H+-ATPase subunit I/STV1
MSKTSNGFGTGLITAGILMAIVGLFAYFYGEDTMVLDIVVATTYPYRDIGGILLVMGIITAIVGAVTSTVRQSDS